VNKYINSFILILLIVSCSSYQTNKEKNKKTFKSVINPIPINKKYKPLYGNLLSNISISKPSFNPINNEKQTITFNISRPSKVVLNIYDSDSVLIKKLNSNKYFSADKNSLMWDGRDNNGNIVPNEAYFFTIIANDESGVQEIYDPTMFSGGVENDIVNVEINPDTHDISYTMIESGRVMIRIGIQSGPLLNTLVDWEPRAKGLVTEYWNGKDKNNLVYFYKHPKFKMIIVYFSFPENSFITYGNRKLTYREYKKRLYKKIKKPRRPFYVKQTSPHYHILRTEDYSPKVKMSLKKIYGKNSEGLPIIKDKTIVTVEIDEEDKPIFQNFQFEICFFLDYQFYAEDESGSTPFNWVWDLSNVNKGEHILTANITSFKDQIGVISKKVWVKK